MSEIGRRPRHGLLRLSLCSVPFLLIGPPVLAQLDATCTVSALNRTVRVDNSGVWVLPNVPVNSGPIRVRATCVDEDGSLRSGQSDFFVVSPNGIVEAPAIRFDTPQPVPARLSLSSPLDLLSTAGEEVQLVAILTFPDGSTADATSSAAGTRYISTNPVIATVSLEGVVTAHASGNVLISASNEGTLSILRLAVVLSGDSDGDGFPDDFELANGLDPNNPFDALDDQDEDGLSAADEFALGLDPFNPDTDTDGLLDGEEVNAIGTDALLFDTDGDGLSDGLEVSTGSDPLDPDSFDLGAALDSLEVFPAFFDLVFDTALGEASRRLEVTGTLIDGTTIDLRSPRYGTTYASSDLTIASFGAEDGRVFAGSNGVATITVAVGGQIATSVVTVSTFSPVVLSYLPLPGFPNGVDVAEGYAYVASGSEGLFVIDVLDPSHPLVIGRVDTPGNANDVKVSGTFAYVAAGDAGLVVVDVADATAPFVAAQVDTPGIASDLVVVEDLVFVADGAAGVVALDVTDPGVPAISGTVDTPGNARGIDAVDDLLLVADGPGGVQVIDAADPAAMAVIGATHTRGGFSLAADVAAEGRKAYVADGGGNLGGLRVIDFRVPTTPVVIGSTSDEFGLVGVAVDGGSVLAADYFFVNAVPIFDVGPPSPGFTGILDFSEDPFFSDNNGTGLVVQNGLVYLTAANPIGDNGVRGSGGLHIGRYRQIRDEFGIPPNVSIVAPSAELVVNERRRFVMTVEASDDIRVTRVRFLADGEVVAEALKAPYVAQIVAATDASTLTLGAEAFDLGGNVGSAEPVVISVIPDSTPVAELLSPSSATVLHEGAVMDVAAVASDDLQVTSVEFLIDGLTTATLETPPYRISRVLPVGQTTVEVEVRAIDGLDQVGTTGPHVFAVADDPPPQAFILEPAVGAEVVEGSTLAVVVGAVDTVGVSRAGVVVDGIPGPEDLTAPYEVQVAVPVGATQISLQARAVDSVGEEGLGQPLVLPVVPDPGTTAIGSVELEGQPVAGAAVVCNGQTGSSDLDGSFSIAGVPTVAVDVQCSASYTDAGGRGHAGTSLPVRPVRNGFTDVGPISLVPSLFEPDFGASLDFFDGDSIFLAIPFPFTFFGQTYTGIWINDDPQLTFTMESADWTETREEFVSGLRFSDFSNPDVVGPAIALFWDDFDPFPGVVDAENDLFTFQGTAGDQIEARVLVPSGSQLDSVIVLYDENGEEVDFTNGLPFSRDARLSTTLPATGAYFLDVQDDDDNGTVNSSYTLRLESGGIPLRDPRPEFEPNDDFASAMPIAYGDVINGVLSPAPSATTRNVHVNDQLAGRFVVTWNGVPEVFEIGSNTMQATLFSDGRVQFVYRGVTADDAIVGVSPGNGASPLEVDFTNAPFSGQGAIAIFEEFDGPIGPDSTAEDPPGDRPFDLDGAALVFTPNTSGSFDVELVAGGGHSVAPFRTGSPRRVASGLATGTAADVGSISGQLLSSEDRPMAGVEVLVTSSGDPSFQARLTTDAAGRFRLDGVPFGGVNVVSVEKGRQTQRGAGILDATDPHLHLVLRPRATKSKVR